jgi:hypothetical protein
VRIDAARAERDDVPRTVELWRGLVAGRGHWSNTSNATAGATTWHTRTTPSSQPIAD